MTPLSSTSRENICILANQKPKSNFQVNQITEKLINSKKNKKTIKIRIVYSKMKLFEIVFLCFIAGRETNLYMKLQQRVQHKIYHT